jgi:hypothetical protein
MDQSVLINATASADQWTSQYWSMQQPVLPMNQSALVNATASAYGLGCKDTFTLFIIN